MRLLLTAFVALVTMFLGPARAQIAPNFTLLLDWFVNPDHGPIFVAQELGYFRDAGLVMEIVAPANPNDPPKLVAAKRGDVPSPINPR